MKAIWAENTAYSKFLISSGVILLCFILFTLMGMGIVTLIYGISFTELQALIANKSHPQSVSILKLMQIFAAIGTFIIPAFFLSYVFSNNSISYLGLDKKPAGFSLILVTVLMIIATPFINFMAEFNVNLHLPASLSRVEEWMRNAEQSAAEMTKAFLNMESISDLFFNLFMIALIPAIGEELLFRGIIQKLFQQSWKNIHVAVWLSAILFSSMHMQFYGFIPRMVLGAMLGYMLVWSGSLWVPIVAHFINNAAAVVFVYLFQSGQTSIDPDKIGTGSDFGSVAGSVLFTVILFWVFYRREKERGMLAN